MLKISGLIKIYNKGKSNSVSALNRINAIFPEKGLVFITGKSGCGKSTFLHILGGLDGYDCGDITLDGKSYSSFTSKQLENFRNNTIGYVFQEFNLFEDMTVEDNLSLALDLQGRTASNELIKSTLSSIGLEGYEKRKASELSGGEKQRIAVARALIKDSKIILADEPTGNLDSKTSEELFSLLKRISEDKLVIIASHDLESANEYADRIIEMKDGRIITDSASGNVSLLKKDVNKSTNEDIIAKGKMKVVKVFKLLFRNVRRRKVRLITMIALFAFAIGFFGIGVDSLTLDNYDIAFEKMQETGIKSATLARERNEQSYSEDYKTMMTKEDIQTVESAMGQEPVEIYSMSNFYFSFSLAQDIIELPFYNADNYTAACLDGVSLEDYGMKIVAGRLPETINEIAVPYYSYLACEKFGTSDGYGYQSPVDLLGYEGSIVNSKAVVVGVIDTGLDYSDYELLRNKRNDVEDKDKKEYDALENALNNETYLSLHTSVFVTREKLNEISLRLDSDDSVYSGYDFVFSGAYTDDLDGAILIEGKTTLGNDEIVMSKYNLAAFHFIVKQSMSQKEFDEIYSKDMIADEELLELITNNEYSVRVTARGNDDGLMTSKNLKIVGFTDGNKQYVSQNVYDEVNRKSEDCIAGVVVKLGEAEDYAAVKDLLIKYGKDTDNREILTIHTAITDDMSYLGDYIEIMTYVGLCGSLVFGIFAVVLILNFFIVSINDRKKDIGILTSLGISKGNLIIIFLVESLAVALISALISLILVAIVAAPLDLIFASIYKTCFYRYSIYGLNLINAASMIGVALITAFVGSVGPVVAITRKRPTDMIKSW